MDFNYYFSRGQNHLLKREFDKAIIEIKNALNFDPSQFLGWVTLSTCYFLLGKLDKSLEASRNIAKYNRNIKDGYDLLNTGFQYIKNLNIVENDYEEVISDPSSFTGEWMVVGSHFLKNKEYDKALKSYKYSTEQHPDWPIVWLNLSSVYIKKENYDKAIETINNALKIQPDFKYGFFCLATAHFKMNNIEKAENICEKILQLDPLFEEAVKLQCKILKEKGKPTIDDENPIEIYGGLEVRKDQKQFLVELEEIYNRSIKPKVKISKDYMQFSSEEGFVARAGYIIELSLGFAHSIPESIGNLKYLKILHIPYLIDPKGLPESIVKLQNLENFTFTSVILGRLPSRNKDQLIYLDKKICQLKALKKLNVRDSYSITHLPDCLANLQFLQEINIGNCHNLRVIPDKIKINFEPVGDDFHLNLVRRSPNINNPNEGWENSKFLKTFVKDIPKKIQVDFSSYDYDDLPIEEVNFLKELDKSVQLRISRIESIDYRRRKRDEILYTIKNGNINELSIYSYRKSIDLVESIKNLKKLEKLSLSKCQIPETIGKLQFLKEISLSCCNIPKSIVNLKSLKKLVIVHCKNINQLSNIKKLEKLEILEIYEDKLFPESITDLPSLKELKIYDANQIRELPITLGNLKTLEILNLRNFRLLESLPDSIGKLHKLRELSIQSCFSLKSLPKSIGLLRNLNKLKIYGCIGLHELPDTIQYLNFLQELEIRNCKLEVLPIGLKDLKHLKKLIILNNPISPSLIYEKFENQIFNEEETKYQLKYIIESWVEPELEFYGQEDFVIEQKNIRKEAIELFSELIMKKKQIPIENENNFMFFESILVSDEDSIIRNAILKNIIKLFPKKCKNCIVWIIENEKSFLILKNLYYILKEQPNLKELWKKLINRFSNTFKISSQQIEGILQLFFIHLIEDYEFEFDIILLNKYRTDNIEDIKESYKRIPLYAVKEGNVIALNLSGFGFDHIPEFIQSLKHVQYLNLSHNQLISLPNWLNEMKELNDINLSHNKFNEFPQLPSQIKNANIKHNNIDNIPKESLNHLILKYKDKGISEKGAICLAYLKFNYGLELNQESSINKAIQKEDNNSYVLNNNSNLIGLIINDFEESSMVSIPRTIIKLISLKALCISNIYSLKYIPKSINSLKNLTFLKLNGNNIHEIPRTITELKNLEYLNFANNNIIEIPRSINKLYNLKVLDLSYNSIKKIPTSLSKLSSLKFLSLNGNDLTTIPPSINYLENIEELYLGFNKIEIIPENLTNLTSLIRLSLCANKIKIIPDNIGNLKNLKMLNLFGNKLEKVPESIVLLKKLDYLNLSENNLESVPDSLADIESLKYFNLSFNNMEAPSPKINSIRGFLFKRKKDLEFFYEEEEEE